MEQGHTDQANILWIRGVRDQRGRAPANHYSDKCIMGANHALDVLRLLSYILIGTDQTIVLICDSGNPSKVHYNGYTCILFYILFLHIVCGT